MMAAIIPPVEIANARSGTPPEVRPPIQAGAYSPRESENNIRVDRYKFVFALDSAAEITTKFMMPAA